MGEENTEQVSRNFCCNNFCIMQGSLSVLVLAMVKKGFHFVATFC